MYQKRNNIFSILSLYLADYNRQFYLREISRLSRIPLKTTQNLMSHLEKEKVIKNEISGKNKYFRLNLDNIKTKFYMLQSEVHKSLLFIEKYQVFKTFLKEIKTNPTLVVFGSFAKFNPEKDSDLDILAVSKERVNLPSHLLPYKIHQISISEDDFVKAVESRESLAKEIQQNHIILNNHSNYVDIMWRYYEKQ